MKALRIIGLYAAVVMCTQLTPEAWATTSGDRATMSPSVAPPGPQPGGLMTEAYARSIARTIYVWSWPMVNVYNRRLVMEPLKEPGRLSGALPVAPVNHLSMLTDYIEPQQRDVTCPNQDVVYGSGPLVLDKEPVVVQVPDFGDRFWVYQVVDIRTDSFANLNRPGFRRHLAAINYGLGGGGYEFNALHR